MALIHSQEPKPVKTVTFVDAAHSTSDNFESPLFSNFALTQSALEKIKTLSKVVRDSGLRSVQTDLEYDCHFHNEDELRLIDWVLVVSDEEFWVTAEIKHSGVRVETDSNLISFVAKRFEEAQDGDLICLSDEDVLDDYKASLVVFGVSDIDKAILLCLATSFKNDLNDVARLSDFPHFSFQFEGEELVFTDDMKDYFRANGVSFKAITRQLNKLRLVSLHPADDESKQVIARLFSELEGQLQTASGLV
jgi:hypothetical protein